MPRREKKISIFSYLDYREFMRDWYQESKRTRRGFSFRYLSQKAGFTSPNFFKLVMDGDRNLSEDSLEKFVTCLDLNKQEGDYFANLVLYNQASHYEKKDHYYKRLLQSRKLKQIRPLKKDHYEYCSTWYHSVIRELVISENFDGTPEWLVQRIHPPITMAQAARSLEILQHLGLIEKGEEGRFRQSSALLQTGEEPTDLELMNFHQGVLELAQEMLPKIPARERDVSAMTLGIRQEMIPELKQKIREFRQEILRMISDDSAPEAVVMLTLQLFPLTQEPTKEVQ